MEAGYGEIGYLRFFFIIYINMYIRVVIQNLLWSVNTFDFRKIKIAHKNGIHIQYCKG